MKNMKKSVKILLTAASLVMCVGLLFSVALSCVYNKAHMTTAFQTYAHPQGHDEIMVADYETIAGQIVQYLSTGKAENLPALRGEKVFSDRENAHLADCSRLTRGMGYVRLAAIALLAAVMGWVLLEKDVGRRKQKSDALFQAFSWAAGVLMAGILAVTVWGLVNFNGLFVTFHKVCFNNDLWLMDPAQDLLIQMMPLPFFTDYALYLLKTMAPMLLLLAALPVAGIVFYRKNRKAEQA